MNKKPSRTPGPSIFLLRLFASPAAMLFLALPLHAGAQQLQETSINQPMTTAFASSNPSRLPVDVPSDSLVDAPSAVFSRAAATVDAAPAGVVRPLPAKLARRGKS